MGGLDVESVTLDQRDAQMELTLQAVETTVGVSLSLQYIHDLFDRETAESILSAFREFVSVVADAPGPCGR